MHNGPMGSLATFRRRYYEQTAVGAAVGAGLAAIGMAFGLLLVVFEGGPIELPITDIAVAAAFGALVALLPRLGFGAAVGFAIGFVRDAPGTYWQSNQAHFQIVVQWSAAALVLYLPIVVQRLPHLVGAAPTTAREVRKLAASRIAVVGPGSDPWSAARHSIRTLRHHARSAGRVRPPALAPVLTRERDGLVLAVAAVLYLVGRIATDRFYAPLGVTAEEVGVTTPSLLLGAALATIILIGLGVAVIWMVRFLVGFSAGRLTILVGLGIIVGTESLPWPALAGVAFGLATGSFAWVLSDDQAFWTATFGTKTLATLVVVLGAAAIVAAFVVSANSVDNVRAGRANTPSIGPLALGPLHAPSVEVWSMEDAPLPTGLDEGSCVSWLGSSDGISVLHRAGRVWRLPNETIVLVATECRR